MNLFKVFLSLCLGILFSSEIYAQDIREINIEKPGKLKKLIKKELNTITKLRLTGTANKEDFEATEMITNLEYLDLRELNLDVKDKKHGFYDAERLGKHWEPIGPYSTLKEVHFPNNIKEVYMTAPSLQKIYISLMTRFDFNDGRQTKKYNTENLYIESIPADGTIADYSFHDADSVIFVGCTPSKEIIDKIDANIIYVKESGYTKVNRWDKPLTTEIIKSFDCYGSSKVFEGNTYKENVNVIEFSENVEVIHPALFADFTNLEEVKLPSKIKVIGGSAFRNTSVRSIDIPSSVIEYGYEVFYKGWESSSLKSMTLHTLTPPEWLSRFRDYEINGLEITIPDGSFLAYQQFNEKNGDKFTFLDNKKYGSYKINVPKGNTILSYISLDDLITCDSLTISGILYENDFKFIRRAKRMKYLDISNCYTTYSKELLEESEKKNQAMAQLFKVISAGLDDQYNEYKIGSIDYIGSKALAEQISKAYAQGYSDDDMCLIPHLALYNMNQLEVLKLPTLVTRIGPRAMSGCTNLKKVDFPPFLNRIANEAFAYCYSLENFELPKTVNWIEEDAFLNCNSITRFVFPDMTKTKEFRFEKILSSCVGLEEIVFSEGMTHIPPIGSHCYNLKKVYFPSTATEFHLQSRNWSPKDAVPCEFHFKSATPPERYSYAGVSGKDFGENATIYIPRGTITAYMAKYGEGYGKTRYKYVEE